MSEYVGTPREVINWLLGQDMDKTYAVKEQRKRRSLTQNGYYWALADKLSAALRIGKHEVHELMLKRYAPTEVVTVLKEVPLQDYFEHCEVFAEGTLNGKEYNHVRIYKGSSKMDSAEFARLLDGIRDECEQQGIQTMTPSEMAALPFVEPKGE